jgi:hypothetical protein
LLSAKHPVEYIEACIVTEIEGEWPAPVDVELDSVLFKDVTTFSVERFTHPLTKAAIDFPVRSFVPLLPTGFGS